VKSGFDVNVVNIGSAASANWFCGASPRICWIVRNMFTIV
jgi:hypothetical protein